MHIDMIFIHTHAAKHQHLTKVNNVSNKASNSARLYYSVAFLCYTVYLSATLCRRLNVMLQLCVEG